MWIKLLFISIFLLLCINMRLGSFHDLIIESELVLHFLVVSKYTQKLKVAICVEVLHSKQSIENVRLILNWRCLLSATLLSHT